MIEALALALAALGIGAVAVLALLVGLAHVLLPVFIIWWILTR